MRQYILLAAIPVSFLTGAWLGYTMIPEQLQTDATPGGTPAIAQSYTRIAEQHTKQDDNELLSLLSGRMDVIHSELQAMKSSLDQLLITNQPSITSLGESSTAGNISTANIGADSITADEIVYVQNNIIAQLSDPSFTIQKLNAMPEFQKLPEEDKIPVLDEIARRLDTGEVDKSTFLPGYDPATEN